MLIIHLNRYIKDGKNYRKNEILINFNLRKLEMKSYLFEEAPNQNTLYNLYAVTVGFILIIGYFFLFRITKAD